MGERRDVSIVICSRDRAGSLAETLTCLEALDAEGIDFEVVVVDNGSRDETPERAAEFASRLPLRLLHEPRSGKSHALNRALDAGALGEIVVFLDDDMSPHRDWLRGVVAACARHPEADFFGGRSYVVWPSEPPSWARRKGLEDWAFSAIDLQGDEDRPISLWPSGNHFWVRARALAGGRRFGSGYLTEPDFTAGLMAEGRSGWLAPDAVAGHRVQPGLLCQSALLERAARTGRGIAQVRMAHPAPLSGRLSPTRHPRLQRLSWRLGAALWALRGLVARLHPSPDARFERRAVALIGRHTHEERLRLSR